VSASKPSAETWAALYQAAIEFKQIAPWEWMYDSDIFGVQNPDTGEIGYCCIMGNLGEHFALAVYLGTEGLEGYDKIASGELESPEDAILYYQKCLSASFEDRDLLSKPDLDTIKSLGLKFRGRNAWPFFRSYLPGYIPWYLTADEARYLDIALRQAIDVVRRFQENPDLLVPPREGQYLVRVPEQRAGETHWSDQWLAPAPLSPEAIVIPSIDEARVARIKQSISARQGTWEADFFFSPDPVQEGGERPYYPYMFLWVDRQSGMVLPPHLANAENYRVEFQGHFLELIEQARFLPREVCVLKQEALALLEPITQRLGVKLRRSRRLGALEEARDSLMSFFDSR
jgi:hypothetical protein